MSLSEGSQTYEIADIAGATMVSAEVTGREGEDGTGTRELLSRDVLAFANL